MVEKGGSRPEGSEAGVAVAGDQDLRRRFLGVQEQRPTGDLWSRGPASWGPGASVPHPGNLGAGMPVPGCMGVGSRFQKVQGQASLGLRSSGASSRGFRSRSVASRGFYGRVIASWGSKIRRADSSGFRRIDIESALSLLVTFLSLGAFLFSP